MGDHDEYPLHYAVAHGKVEEVRELIRSGADVREGVILPRSADYTSLDDDDPIPPDSPTPEDLVQKLIK